ncbi:putative ABC transporter permease [Adlercreutzia aquisgranensis]|uniref:putative ABC transporter permease n=1 Tax=Adlercreutzia aquisgranensis TaxID=2941323 RepID=UPI0020423368|nr:putative ABC transporter permease [Adlercreutzia aquisgranensis]
MEGGKRSAEKLAEEAAAKAGEMLHEAQAFERADLQETEREWHDQLANDARELKVDVARDAARARQAVEDVRHPSHLAKAAQEHLREAGEGLEHAAKVAADPAELVADAKEAALRRKERFAETSAEIASELTSPSDAKRLPVVLKVLGGLLIAGCVYLLPFIGRAIWDSAAMLRSGAMSQDGISTIVVTFLHLAAMLLLAVTFIVFGARLIRNQRRWAAVLSYGLYVLIVLGALCSIMLRGIDLHLVFYLMALVVVIALQSYLDPTLLEERRRYRKRRQLEERKEGEEGVLGRDLTGKGYIALNFFNLFWIFVVASMVGLLVEELFHYFVVVPGQWQDRAGLLFGPFSPIYGCGAVLMTVLLNRFHKSNPIVIFFVAAVIGGAFEYFTSLFMQYAFGAVAWNYTGMWLSIGGRTCGLFMAMWGLLGLVWIRLLLPFVLHVVNLIPWNWRYGITTVAAALMLVDAVMSLQALDCWYMRLSHDPVQTPIQQFYAEHFDDAFMADRFQSMTIDPGSAVRNG